MTRLLLRAPKDPFEVAGPEATLLRNLIAGNSGNLVFLEAAWRLLATRDADLTPDRLRVDPRAADAINERFDAYVIPLANAFRIAFEPGLLRLTALIRRLRIPVVVLGVGAQGTVDYRLDRLRPIERSVRAFASAVLDRGPSIGVRGELTHDYLRGLGFRDVEVIGCPSMYLHGPELRVEKRAPALAPDARIALNVSPYVTAMADVVATNLARYPNLVYVAQDLDTLEMLVLGGARDADGAAAKLPVHRSHPLLTSNRIRFFLDPWPWLEQLRSVDFSFGTRIHGNITSLLAGTPAYVFAHDSRTLELARYFGIPHRAMRDVPADVDPAALYEEADYAELVRGHPARFAAFASYLERHGLRHVFLPGEDPGRFCERVAATPWPPAVDATTAATTATGIRGGALRARYGVRRLVRAQTIRQLRTALLRRRVANGDEER